MSRKKKIAIIVIIVLLLLLLLLAWLLRPKPATLPGQVADPGAELDKKPPGSLGSADDVYVAPQEPAEVPDQVVAPEEEVPEPVVAQPEGSANIRRLAMAFAERFGSFSNQGDYENLEELMVFMSTRMKGWAEAYVENARDNAAPLAADEYYGVTTRAISNELDVFSEESETATVTVYTQRTEREGLAQSQQVKYQSIRIEFVMERGKWKVDGAFWEEDGS